MTISDVRDTFRSLHRPGEPVVMPNAWDPGSAKLFYSLGFKAIATTSAGFAATLGRADGGVTRDEAIDHTAALAAATPLPVNADLEDCFADDPDGVAETIRAAATVGAAGASVEDYTRDPERPIHDRGLAVARVAAAVEAARESGLVLTARCENLIRGVDDLDDTIARLQAYEEAGADVLYAPGLANVADVSAVVGQLGRPVNVLLLPGGPTVPELAGAGVARVSVGGALCWVAWAAVADAARELLSDGTHGYDPHVAAGGRAGAGGAWVTTAAPDACARSGGGRCTARCRWRRCRTADRSGSLPTARDRGRTPTAEPSTSRGYDAAAVSVAEVHQAVVKVALVGDVERPAPRCPPHDGERQVEHGNTEDEQRQDEWGEEEVRLTDEALIGVGPAADHARGDGHQQAEEEGPAVAHEDARRTEVVRQEADAQADGDDRDRVGRGWAG